MRRPGQRGFLGGDGGQRLEERRLGFQEIALRPFDDRFQHRIPLALLSAIAPLAERLTKVPRGALRGLLDGMGTDLIGDPTPIRALLPRPLLSYGQAAAQALTEQQA